MLFTTSYQAPFCRITMSSNGKQLTGLWLDKQESLTPSSFPLPENTTMSDIFKPAETWLDCYFEGKCPGFTPDLTLDGTPFQLEVWNLLKTIPYGETVCYKDIAREIARIRKIKCMSAQAVGRAIGQNPISLIIPCHRVIGSNGNLTGYAGGIHNKLRLLTLEGVSPSRLFMPGEKAYADYTEVSLFRCK